MLKRKFQMVMDPIMEEALAEVDGKDQTDKMRWALCVYAEAQKAERLVNGSITTVNDVIRNAARRIRNGNTTTERKRR